MVCVFPENHKLIDKDILKKMMRTMPNIKEVTVLTRNDQELSDYNELFDSLYKIELLHNINLTRFRLYQANIVANNQGLVHSISRKHMHKFASITVKNELSDIIQAGNMGLFRAIEKYDVYQKASFTTYAS
jgi:DNA-directed RNA polymerase sigma subunit (sigma70/sigma32)